TRDAYLHPFTDTGFYATTEDQRIADTSLLRGAFMIYLNQFRGLDPDRDIGDFDGDDFFFEMATPVGMMVSNGMGYAKPKVKADTACRSWHICVSDPKGVRSVQILDDPEGNYVKPGKKFHNLSFDPTLDPDNIGEIDFSGADTLVCFDLIVGNSLDSARGSLFITNSGGMHADPLPEFVYQPTQVRLSKLPDLPLKIDSLIFPSLKIGDEICSTLVYINTASGLQAKPFNVLSVALVKNTPQFTITSISPKLPVTLKAGDTLKVQVCFKPNDTLQYSDSIVFTTDCFHAPLPIVGSGGTALIFATDADFGDVVVGTTLCKTLTVRNVGSVPFLLTKEFLLHDTVNFSIAQGSITLLPTILMPGAKPLAITVCYSPRTLHGVDTSRIDWITDVQGAYKNQLKSFSLLRGRPIDPSVKWDRVVQYFVPDSTAGIDSVIERVHLLNESGTTAEVNAVKIIGQDSAEFYILNDQLGKLPLVTFPMSDKDEIWVDIVFKPDLTKPYPARFADRSAQLIAVYINPADLTKNDTTAIRLIGTWNKNEVKQSLQASAFSIRPNPSSGNSLTLSFSSEGTDKISFSIFDVLGREVYRNAQIGGRLQSSGKYEENILLPNLEPGLYYARLTVGNSVSTEKLEIVK
ncbi:MAG: T9SS type A sorting domain-containing protein, partial [Ignavibacteriota bacterium]